jgi:hypothetical protein
VIAKKDRTGADMIFPFSLLFPARQKSAVIKLVPAKNVVSIVHGTRTVLMDTKHGHYWGLDDVGSRIWMLAREGYSVAAITHKLSDEYDAPEAQLQRDVQRFVASMCEMKLLEVA